MKKTFVSIFSFVLVILFMVTLSSNNIVMAQEKFDNLSCKSYIVIDESGNILVENNCDKKYEVASICKLMTTLLTLEKIENNELSLDDKVVASKYACDAEGSQAFLDSGSEYSIRDLLKSVIVASANDSAIVLAESIAGSEKMFVEMMNKKAKEIGMNNTLYVNSTGLPDNNQYSTARDTSILLNVVSKYPLYKEDCQIWMDKLIHPSGRETELVNTNRLIKYYPNCVTGKTGFTDEAGYCLASTAKNNNFYLTCVVLGCDTMADRFKDSMTLYNYCFANFENQKIIDKNELVENDIFVLNGKANSIDVVSQNDFYLTKRRGENDNITLDYVMEKNIKAPIDFGQKVGNIIVKQNDKIIKEISLVSNSKIDKQNFKDIMTKIIDKFNMFN